MTEIFAASLVLLILAHLIADFVLQTKWMVDHKTNPGTMALHGLIVFATTFAALGGQFWLSLAVTAAHIVIDLVKTHLAPNTLWAFVVDQTAHVVTLVYAATLAQAGLTQILPAEAIQFAALGGGLILATMAGAPAVGLLMAPFRVPAGPEGLKNAGKIIGLLERGLIFMMVIIGEPAAIGFLIAAKSILRFDTVSKDQQLSEYVIIGTLASFGWALMAAYAALSAASALGY